MWIVSGPSCIGKSFFLANGKDRLSELTNLPPFEGGEENGAFTVGTNDRVVNIENLSARSGTNICLHMCIGDKEHTYWRRIRELGIQKEVIILGVPYSEFKHRIKRPEKPADELDLDVFLSVYRLWIAELNKREISYLLVEAIGDYKILEEKAFFKMLKN